MASHAKPRTRVRSAAMGLLTVGATLTGLGLTAAAFDPAGTAGATADGSFDGSAVGFSAAGLGAPVAVPLPVTDVVMPIGGGSPAGGSQQAVGAAGAGRGSVGGGLERGRPIQPTAHEGASAATAVTNVATEGSGASQSHGTGESGCSAQGRGSGSGSCGSAGQASGRAAVVQSPAGRSVEAQVTAVQSAVESLLNRAAQATGRSALPALPSSVPGASGGPAVSGLLNEFAGPV